MNFGLILPGRGRLCTPDNLVDLALAAEESGFDSVWLTDHVAMPRTFEARYPYTPSGKVREDVSPGQPWLEITTAMTWVLSRTKSVQVGTAVLVAALRPAVLLAKQLSSMAFLAGPERLLLGLGAGWLTEEVDALQLPSDRLGARLSDTVGVLRWCWSGAAEPFVGATYAVPPLHFAPGLSAQRSIPILIGGHSRAALRRVAEIGDGWIASHLAPEAIAECLETVRQLRHDAGLAVDLPDSQHVLCRLGPTPDLDVEQIGRYARAGVTHLVLDLPYSEMRAEDIGRHLDALIRTVTRARAAVT